MFCPRCGIESAPEHKFCKSCGSPLPATGAAQPQSAGPVPAAPAAPAAAAYQYAAPQAAAPQQPPPGMVPVVYQAYPGGPQQIYYMPASQVHARAHQGMMEGLTSRIRKLASTDKLEGFSLREMFSEVFKRRGGDAVEEYFMVGAEKTTPPLELVETGWPKPWMFFRLLAAFLVAYIVMAFMYSWTSNPNLIPGIMLLGAFAVPLATLTLFFELNTPRNVSLHRVGMLFLMGAVVSLGVALLGYAIPIFQLATMEAGIVEEVAKLLTVVIVMRTARYKYILNGILFGATVGAGFAAFETAGYALNAAFLPGFVNTLVQAGSISQQAMTAATNAGVSQMLAILALRGIEAPLGHVAWTAISAGAFWRVKGDRPVSPGMLFDRRFLMAFAIPVALHAIWDAPIQLHFSGNQIITGLITWYVVFGLVQQGLRQVREEQKLHLQNALTSVEATLGLGTMRPQMIAPPPVIAQPPMA